MIAIPAPIYDRAHDLPRIFADRPNTDDADRAHLERLAYWTDYIRIGVKSDLAKHKRTTLAAHVLDDIPGFMVTEKAVALGRAALNGDKEAVFAIVLQATEEAIKANAECFAEED